MVPVFTGATTLRFLVRCYGLPLTHPQTRAEREGNPFRWTARLFVDDDDDDGRPRALWIP